MLYFTAQVSITVLSRNNHSGLPYPISIENTFYNIPLFSRTFAKTLVYKNAQLIIIMRIPTFQYNKYVPRLFAARYSHVIMFWPMEYEKVLR